jgi:hypothetical protein
MCRFIRRGLYYFDLEDYHLDLEDYYHHQGDDNDKHGDFDRRRRGIHHQAACLIWSVDAYRESILLS